MLQQNLFNLLIIMLFIALNGDFALDPVVLLYNKDMMYCPFLAFKPFFTLNNQTEATKGFTNVLQMRVV